MLNSCTAPSTPRLPPTNTAPIQKVLGSLALCFAVLFLGASLTLPTIANSQEAPDAAAEETPITPSDQADTPQDAQAPDDSAQSNTEAAKPAPPKPLGPGQQYSYNPQQQQTLIESELQAKHTQAQSIWLSANDTDFLALWHKDTSGNPQGALLILPSENTNPANQHKLNNIQHYLSQHGWSTLTLSLPKQQQKMPPKRPPAIVVKPQTDQADTPEDGNPDTEKDDETEKANAEKNNADQTVDESKVVHDDSAEDLSEGKIISTTTPDDPPAQEPQESNEPVLPAEEIAIARIKAGIKHLESKKQFNNIVFAEGISAARIIRAIYSEEAQTDTTAFSSIRGLILLNSSQEIQHIPEFDFFSAFEKITLPTFDIIESASGRANLDIAMQQLTQRTRQAKISEMPVYLSRKIQPSPQGTKGELRLTRIIRGFLYQHAQGMERDTN